VCRQHNLNHLQGMMQGNNAGHNAGHSAGHNAGQHTSQLLVQDSNRQERASSAQLRCHTHTIVDGGVCCNPAVQAHACAEQPGGPCLLACSLWPMPPNPGNPPTCCQHTQCSTHNTKCILTQGLPICFGQSRCTLDTHPTHVLL
jgi:hypothetical protein